MSKDSGRLLKANVKIVQAPLGVMAPQVEKKKHFLLHIPVLVKSKTIFCHCDQIFMWSLGICEQTF